MIAMDTEGYLLDHEEWSPAVASLLAERDGLELGDDHWQLIDFLHRFYGEYELAPELTILSRQFCRDQKDCRWTRKYIQELFPGGAKMACRYAGLPLPRGRCCLC
jgi:tRNA 2-thiouridine synthesizing protein E